MFTPACACVLSLRYFRFIVPTNFLEFTLNSPSVLVKECRRSFYTTAYNNNKALPKQKTSYIESKEETSLIKKKEETAVVCGLEPEKKKLTFDDKIRNMLFKAIPSRTINKYNLIKSVHGTYEKLMEEINVEEFFEEFQMPDTFASWFTVAELHTYILSTRLMKNEKCGLQARDMLTDAFWNDVQFRSRKLGNRASHYRIKQLGILGYQFQAAFYGYDEGVQSNDMVLAAIVWRRFFGFDCDDARKIERVVKYIRVQINYLSLLDFDDIISDRKVLTIPLKEIRVD